jgi:hypothetical protein
MAALDGNLKLCAMKTFRPLIFVSMALLLFCTTASAQFYHVTFRGTSYETNGTGNIVATPLTDRTLLEAAAQNGGITTNDLTLVYHAEAGGDSIKVIKTRDGTQLMTYFLFLFGQQSNLGRIALTNLTQTEIRGVDYVYTLNTSPYTSWNSHSMGSVFITKRILTDAQNNVRQSVDGLNMQWIVLPQGNRSAKVCIGNFQTGALFKPH